MTDLEGVPEELQPEAGKTRLDDVVALLAGAALMLVYMSASAVWPGPPAAWMAVGLSIWVAALWRVWGPPWRRSS